MKTLNFKTMKLWMVCLLVCFGQTSVAQTIAEPEKDGQIYVITGEESFESLPKEAGSLKTSAGLTSLLPTAVLKQVKSYIKINGGKSKVRYTSDGNPVKFIIRLEAENINPERFINIIKLEEKKKERRILLAKSSLLGGTEAKTWETVPFEYEKYGEYSYLVTANLEQGEYGIMLSDVEEESNFVLQFRTVGIE